MIFAAAMATEQAASNIGYWVLGAALVIPAASVALSVIFTRREAEKMEANSDRRLAAHEAVHLKHEGVHKDLFSKIGGVERGGNAADKAVQEQLRDETYKLHEKINVVDRAVASIETETRIQSGTLRAIAAKLNVPL